MKEIWFCQSGGFFDKERKMSNPNEETLEKIFAVC
jgi:hypothetical protein